MPKRLLWMALLAASCSTGLDSVRQLVGGDTQMCALDTDGQVACWSVGGSQEQASRVEGLEDVEEITAYGASACARRRGGSVVCWGEATWRIWDGYEGSPPFAERPEPVIEQAERLAGACALSSGVVRCWPSDTAFVEGTRGHSHRVFRGSQVEGEGAAWLAARGVSLYPGPDGRVRVPRLLGAWSIDSAGAGRFIRSTRPEGTAPLAGLEGL